MLVTVKFEDHGQDFLEWDIDTEKEMIVDSRPFQASIWAGCPCTQKKFRVGGQVTFFSNALNEERTINYPIQAVVKAKVKSSTAIIEQC